MRIELNHRQTSNHQVKGEERKTFDMFELIFSKNLKTEKETQKNSPVKENFIQLSAKKLLDLENKLSDPKAKKIINDLIERYAVEKNSKLEIGTPVNNKEVSNIKNVEFELKIPAKELKQFITTLEKVVGQKIDLKVYEEQHLQQVNNEGINLEEKGKKEGEILESSINIERASIQNKEKVETKDKTIVIEGKELLFEDKKESLKKEKDPFEELKSHRLETHIMADKVVPNADVVKVNNNLQVTSVKNEPMKISDWIDSFKQEIDKLSEFRIENKQKVSMILKEQGEQLRIVVEKRDSYILIEAGVTDNMRDKLNSILAEVQSEMKDKGIEVRLEIKQEKENKREESNKENNENQQQGGARNGKHRNKSDE